MQSVDITHQPLSTARVVIPSIMPKQQRITGWHIEIRPALPAKNLQEWSVGP